MTRPGLVVTNVKVEQNILKSFCVMWAQFTVKSIKSLPKRLDSPELEVYEVVIGGLDSKKDYRALMTSNGILWKIEFYFEELSR